MLSLALTEHCQTLMNVRLEMVAVNSCVQTLMEAITVLATKALT